MITFASIFCENSDENVVNHVKINLLFTECSFLVQQKVSNFTNWSDFQK